MRVSSNGLARLLPCGAFIALALVAGCSSESPATALPSPDATPTSLEPSPSFRDFMRRVFGPGNTFEETCRAGRTDSVRITHHDPLPLPLVESVAAQGIERVGYTVLVSKHGQGAVAQWRGIGELIHGYGFRTYGMQSVRLDGNGWRQVQQALREPRFLRIEPFATWRGRQLPDGGHPMQSIEHCRAGRYRLVMRIGHSDDAGSREFHRVAETILRLGGDVYPGDADDPRQLAP